MGIAAVLGGVLALPVLVLLVLSRWGVLVAVVLALLVGLGLAIWRRGVAYVEITAFLIHFDGLGMGPIRTGRVMAAITLVLILYKLIQRWRPPAVPLRHWGPIWVFTAWAVFSGLWSPEPGGWFFTMGQYGLGLAYFCLTAMLLDSHRMVQQFLRAYWVGGLFGSAAGIVALFLGTRSVGFGGDPNFFGLLEASMVPLTVYYRRHAVTPKAKWMYTIALLVVLGGAAGAGSRSGLIGGAIAIVATMVTRPGLSIGRRGLVSIGAVFLGGFAFLVGFIANPNNLERGFNDRGAGRVDLWNVTVSLIEQNPLWGYGFGQIRSLVPPGLLLTPGSQRLNELRPDVSAHNTWLDVAGDLGAVGLVMFSVVILVALWGFLRPRWMQTRELSTTLFVMMLPVLSSSFFLPLLNNKLAWALIGISAAMHVPSVEARWSGLAAALRSRSTGSAPMTPVLAAPAAPPAPVERVPGERPEAPGEEVWERVRLARWDLGISRRFRRTVILAALVGAILGGAVGASRPTTYTATAGVIVPRVDGSLGRDVVVFEGERLQGALTLAVSGAMAQELIDAADLDASVDEVRDRLDATRPRMGIYVEFTYSDTDLANVEAVLPHMVDSLDRVFAFAQQAGVDQTEDELRPVIPGESRVYTGPAYLRAGDEATLSTEPPAVVWPAFIGFLSGAIIAAGLMLAGQRRPRVTTTDDLLVHIGVPVWAHVGGTGRRTRATSDQYAQVLATAQSFAPDDPLDEHVARRIVVAAPRREPLARNLAVGLAAEVVARGGRALLVDADVQRPMLSARLGGVGRPGLRDVGAGVPLAEVVRRVNPLRLPRTARRMVGAAAEDLRFVPAGRIRRGRQHEVPLAALDQVDPGVTVVVMAPPTLGEDPVAPLLGWADTVVVAATAGHTSTMDLEDAAAQVHSFSASPSGVVLLDG